MVFISNTGKSKTVKSKTGILLRIPSGTKSFVDDPVLNIVVNNDRELKFISKDAFLKSKNRVSVKKQIEEEEKKRAASDNKKQESAKKATEKKQKAEKKKTDDSSEK